MHEHKTANGEKVLICAMEDDHLKNTIAYFLRPLADATQRLSRDLEAPKERSERAKFLYGDRPMAMTAYEYGELYKESVEKIGPYLFEANVRGLDVSDLVHKAAGRTGADAEAPRPLLSSIKGRFPTPALCSGEDEGDEEEGGQGGWSSSDFEDRY